MRIARVLHGDQESLGHLEGDRLIVTRGGAEGRPEVVREIPMAEARLLAPVVPSKIVAIGLNYRKHAEEMGKPLPEEPLMFLKPMTAVVGPDEPIRLTAQSSRVDFEGELAVVIGRRCRNATVANAMEFVLGYTCLNDVTARDLQIKDVQYTRAKGFDTFAPMGPVLATGLDPSNLFLRTRVNGEVRQEASTADLIFSVPQLIAHISSVMTLLPGDVISTGTPSGVGPLQAGDVVEIEIDGIGVLRNPVLGPEAA